VVQLAWQSLVSVSGFEIWMRMAAGDGLQGLKFVDAVDVRGVDYGRAMDPGAKLETVEA